jgi:adenosylcobinamide kinase / adenosylcobinamide-phosphate guanylyltransferase
MTVRVLADGTAGPVGVLVDDPACGRLLLDCGVGVLAAAAFGGVPLAGVSRVLATGTGPDRLDPALPAVVPVHRPDDRPGDRPGDRAAPAGAEALDAGGGEVAWLVPTSRGPLLHCPSPGPLPAQTLRRLPAPVMVTVPLAPAVAAQLASLVAPAPGARVLVTGGSRSGKSAAAEGFLRGYEQVTYVATGPAPDPADAEWADRVRRHRQRRPAGWRTVETTDLAGVLASAGPEPVLVDGLGTWLAAAMDAAGTWAGGGAAELAARTGALVEAWQRSRRHAVAVTDEVGSGVVPGTMAGRRFRDELGRLNASVAAVCDEVWLVTAGIGQRLR